MFNNFFVTKNKAVNVGYSFKDENNACRFHTFKDVQMSNKDDCLSKCLQHCKVSKYECVRLNQFECMFETTFLIVCQPKPEVGI